MAIGYVSQSTVLTPNSSGQLISFTKLNDTLADLVPTTEDDSAWIGKGDEFATESFLDSWSVSVSVEKYCSSQFLAHTLIFCLGHCTATSSPYTISQADPIVDCINVRPFSYLETIRQGGSSVLDRVFVGMGVEEFQVTIGSGPSLSNCKITATYVGTGKYIQPSTLTVPALLVENILRSASLTLAINGVDYVTSANIVSVQFGFKNNIRLDSGYFPGSGFETTGSISSGAVRGRMEFGNRVLNMSFVARFVHGSPELVTLSQQSFGTAVLTVSGSAGHSLSWTLQKTTFRSAVVGNTEGIVTVAVDIVPLKDAVNGLVTAVVTTNLAGIG
jgi:hypothetical protein